MIEIRHLRTIRAIEETGSLTAASARLHLTQSALSHQLKELEDRLGVPLLNRTGRPLRLTEAGMRLCALAKDLLPKVEETIQGIRRLAKGETGRLYIASECHSCLDWLLPRLHRYRQRFPTVELDVVLSASLDPLPQLLNGALDVVLSPDRRPLAGVSWLPLFDYEMKLVVAADHPFAGRAFVEPEDLQDQTLLAYPVERSRLDVFNRFLWPAGVEPGRVRSVEGTTLLLELAALDQGVTVLPEWAARQAADSGRVAMVRLGPDGLGGRLHACVRSAEADLPHVAGFIEDCVTDDA